MSKRVGDHPRDTKAMRANLRCGAKTRAGTECRSPAVSGKKRCRMHGGAQGSGAPKGNQNALKFGFYTRKAIEERRQMTAFMREARETLREIE